MADPRAILIVDDNPETLEIFAGALASEGLVVRTALDAPSALAEVARSAPGAILLDLRLPITDGVGFLRELRATPGVAEIPVAIVTGDYLIDDAIAAACHELGAEIRFKPLWTEDLLELVHDLLGPAQPRGPVQPGRERK